jgi:hypothetical protein
MRVRDRLTGPAGARLNSDCERDVRRLAALAGTIAATTLAGMTTPASAAPRGLSMPIRLSGAIVAVWRGDPARGCAAAGVCDVTGSATYRPGFRGSLDVSRDGVAFGGGDAAQPAVVRAREGGPGTPVACADVLESGFTPLGVDYLGDRLQISLEELDLSAGRCAGPRTLDLAHALPHGSIATRRVRSGPRVLDLSARTKFAAGPFAGEVISTVRVGIGRARSVRRGRLPGVLRISIGQGRNRYWVLDLQYRIKDVTGALVTDFHGLPDPACRALGACGMTGTSAYRLSGVSGRIDLLAGTRLRRGRHRPSVRSALAAVKRGALPVYVDSRLRHARTSISESVTSHDGICSDSLFAEQPYIDARSTSTAVVLLLRSFELGSLGDSLRTRCPGPSQQDVLERASLAHGSVPVAALGSDRLDVALGSTRTFSGSGYAGSRSGQLQLRLELARSRVHVVRG